MKKVILIISMAILASTTLSANEKYFQKMGETLAQMSSCKTIEDYQTLANKFSNIANVETKEWLPLYYEAQCYISMSFMESVLENKDAYLDQAETAIKKMLVLAPGESEAHALHAFYHTGRLVVNPPQRAMTTSPLIGAALGKALGIDPTNPRAQFISLSNEIGTARFFGDDVEPYCESANELLAAWDSYQLKSPIHPNWGKSQVEEIVEGCK